MNRRAGSILLVVGVSTVGGIAAVHRLQEQERQTMRGGILKDQRLLELKRQQRRQEEEFRILALSASSSSSGSPLLDKPPSSPSS
eukprot:c17411_g2_i1 orf=227-481(-)